MPLFLLPLISMLSGIPGLIGQYFTQKANLALQQLQTESQIELAKAQMATEIAKAEISVENTIVGSTSPKFKYFTFILLFFPFVIGCISTKWSAVIFSNLAAMPGWYTETCMTIILAVWGIAVGGPVVSTIFSNLSSFVADRETHKQTLAKINRADYFAAIKTVQGSPLSQTEVNVGNKILDTLGM